MFKKYRQTKDQVQKFRIELSQKLDNAIASREGNVLQTELRKNKTKRERERENGGEEE